MFNFFVDGIQSKILAGQLAEKSTDGKEQTEFLSTVISEFEGSSKVTYMGTAQKYYENQPEILNKKRMVLGRTADNTPTLLESKSLANNKHTHNFMKKLTRQKIGYLIGKPFTLTAKEPGDEKAKNFFEAVAEYTTREFFKRIKNVARDSIVKGIGWLMVYYDEKGELKFRRCNPEEIIPLWQDSDHTVLDAVIRRYIVEQYSGGTKKEITYVDYYTLDAVYHYIYKEGKLVPNEEKESPSAHFNVLTEDEEGNVSTTPAFWKILPFIPFKYDPDELSLLTRIKSLVDEYDKRTSFVADAIDDSPNAVTVVKNYDSNSVEEFVHNKNQYRTMFVAGDGDAKVLNTPLNVQDLDTHLQRVRQDIYEFGQGVNTADKDLRDTSGVALRFLYADLDMDCIDWGSELEWSLIQLFWFVQQDILARTQIDYTDVKYSIIFNTDVIINESETIQNCFTSVGVISKKTIAANHPWTIDEDKEYDDLMAETEEVLELEKEYGETPLEENVGQRAPVQ